MGNVRLRMLHGRHEMTRPPDAQRPERRRLVRRHLRARQHGLPDHGRKVPRPAGGDRRRQGDGCAAQPANREGGQGHARSHVGRKGGNVPGRQSRLAEKDSPWPPIGSWIPLAAGVPTEAMARRMAEVLASPAWQTPLPLPTVDRTDDAGSPAPSGAATFGHRPTTRSPAAWPPMGTRTSPPTIADKTIANAIKKGISEHYDSISGKPLGIRDYCMSCTLVTMMLDGLTQKHKLKLHDRKPAP